MTDIYIKSEVHQSDASVNVSLHHQTLQDDSLFAASHDPVCECELQQCDIKPDPYLQLKQELTPGLAVKSELPASTLNISQNDQHYQDHKAIVSTQYQEYQEDLSMTFSKEYNG